MGAFGDDPHFFDERREIGGAADGGQDVAQTRRDVVGAGASRLSLEGQAQHALEALPQVQGFDELAGARRVEQPGVAQAQERRPRGGGQDFGVAVGVPELQVLGDELDVDQAAAHVLDVPNDVGAVLVAHALAHSGHVAEQLVGVAPARQGVADHLFHLRLEGRRAGDDAGAGECHVFPGPGGVLVIADKRLQAGRDGPGTARRTQAHVHFVEAALRGRCRHRVDEPLGEPGEVLGQCQRNGAVGGLGVVRCVVDEDDIEVRRWRHFTAAQLAQRHHEHSGPRHVAVLAGEFVLDPRRQEAEDDVGDVAQGGRGVARLEALAEALHPHLELAVVGPAPAIAQHVLEVPGLAEQQVQFLLEERRRWRRVEKVGAQHAFQDLGVAAQVLGQARRGADDLRHQVEEFRPGIEHGKELHAGRQSGEETVETDKGIVGKRRFGQRRQKPWHQLGQQLAGPGAAHGAVAPVMPAAHPGVHGFRVLVAERRDGPDGIGIGVRAGENQVAGGAALGIRGAEGRRVLEQFRVVDFDTAQRFQELGGEGAAVGVSEEGGERREFVFVLG